MSLGIETPEQFREMNLKLIKMILEGYKKFYEIDQISLDSYLFDIKSFSHFVDVYPYLVELKNDGKITKERCLSELKSIKANLEDRIIAPYKFKNLL